MATQTDGCADARVRFRPTRADWQAGLFFMLHSVGFLLSTLLITWGLFFLFFLAIGGFSFDGLIHQLNNLTTRYVAADAARTGSFRDTFAIAHMILTAAVIILRRDRILPARATEGASHHG